VNGAICLEAEDIGQFGVDNISDAGNRTNTYIAFGHGGTGNDWAYLRQIGGSNGNHIALDFHDDGNDADFSIRDVKSTDDPDTVTTRFTVVNDKVGCGTDSPVAKLHVASNGPTYTAIGENDRFRIEELVSNGNKFGLQMGIDWGTGHSALQTYALSSAGAYSQNYSLLLQPYGGNVGIGESSPTSKLHIDPGTNDKESPSTTGVYVYNSGTGDSTCTLRVKDSSAGDPYVSFDVAGEAGWALGMDNSDANKFKLNYQWSSLSSDTKLTVDSSGRVGIGTSSPGYKLDVNGTLRATTGTFSGVVTMRGQQDNADGSDRAGYWNYDNKVALVLEPAANDGAVAILFPSQGNKQSDFAYIVYDEDYGEAGVSAGENGALILGCENDGGGSSDHVRVKSRLVVEADQSSSDPTNAFQVKSSNTTSDLFNVTRSGNVGIGTTTPYTPLHVTRSSGSISAAYTIYAKGNDAYYSRQFHVQTSMGWTGMSIYASDDIVTQQYLVSHLGTLSSSDERIKENITDIDDNSALDLVRKLKPKTYEYIDKIKRGSDRVYGFIAQDIESLIPYGTRKVEEVIPNIMEVATVTDSNVISFVNFNTSNLESNTYILQLTDKNGKDILATIESIIDEKTVRVKEDLSTKLYEFDELGNDVTRYSIITKSEYEQLENKSGYTLDETTQTYSKLLSNEIYVYGEKIDNFLKVNKDYIWTVATAALQEVDRQLQAEKAKVATLETQLALVLARLDALENA
jgi:hypothetical protein